MALIANPLSGWGLRRRLARLLNVVPPSQPGDTVRTVHVAGGTLRMGCNSETERYRLDGFFTKEEGTVRWIMEDVQEGQRFCDIGANIGQYSLLAALRVGPRGRVFSFEPHVVNFRSLISNIAQNGFGDRMRAYSLALNDEEGCFDFSYASLEAGVAFNQLDASRSGAPDKIVERKAATTLDALIERGEVEAPHHIKLDVDGIEPRIVRGMKNLLSGSFAPLTVQIEVDPTYASEVHGMMDGFGYTVKQRHETANGKAELAAGVAADTIPHNVVFRRPSSSR